MAVPDHPARNEYHDDFTDDLLAKTRDPIETMDPGTFDSSNVHSGIYDFGERELFLRYLRTGVDAVYQYRNVPAREWDGLVSAASKGSYINANIAYEYTYAKVGRDEMLDAARQLPQSRVKRFVLTP
jgi:hypothetical protein